MRRSNKQKQSRELQLIELTLLRIEIKKSNHYTHQSCQRAENVEPNLNPNLSVSLNPI